MTRRKRLKQPSISLVGAGIVGTTLVTLLAKERYRVASVIGRNGPAAVALARSVACPRVSTEIADIDRTADVIIFAVRDGDLAAAVRSLALIRGLKLRGRTVLHTSGVHTAEALAPLRKSGASVASFHPLQTFPRGGPPARVRASLRGIYYGIDGDDAAVDVARKLAADLGGKPLLVPAAMRPVYHAAAVFASGYLAVVMHAVASLSKTAGLGLPWTEIFGPLMTATMENTVRSSPADAFTGPVLRGDLGTIGVHLEALERCAPEFVPLYTVGALEVARVAVSRGKLPPEKYAELLTTFRSAVRRGKRPAAS
jgi:predicted short-subunit dehydrogenase-like oxidoreductase (DUF2520 family)